MAGALSVVREHIVATPETCGGRPRIAGTRVRVKDVVMWHVHHGLTAPEIVSRWPHLTLAAVYAALSYYHDHREETNAEILADLARYDAGRMEQPSVVRRELGDNAAEGPDAADDPVSS
jgi:uncharacterized protein (DUF433 family)